MRKLLLFLWVFPVLAGMVWVVPDRVHASPQTCPHATEIASVADFLLIEPKEISRFWRDREASDAAFLKIRYSAMPYAEARALLSTLGQRKKVPERWLDLDLSHATPEDRSTRIASLEKPLLNDIAPSAFRALILQDGGEWLLAELARSRDAPQSGIRDIIDTLIARSIADLSDPQKRAFAEKAETAGQLQLARETYAREVDLSDLVAFVDRMPDGSVDATARAKRRTQYLLSALNDALFSGRYDTSVQPQEIKNLVAERPYSVVLAPIGLLESRAPETAILSTLLNQTGKIKIGAIASSLNGDIDAGTLDPDNDPDGLMTAMSERLDYVFGQVSYKQMLAAFAVDAVFTGMDQTALAFLDEAIARDTLGSLIRTGVMPRRPPALSPGFDWERWLSIAQKLRTRTSIDEPDSLIAGMLLMAANDPSEALSVLKTSTDWKPARRLAHMLMLRLDRQCNRLLLRPQALGREPIYRFDAQ